MTLVDESEALHERVRRFVADDSSAEFEDLALGIAEFQARWSPGFRRLLALHGGLSSAARIPAVPSNAFRLSRVAVHPPELDVARFFTSGTSDGVERGLHAMRTTATYSEVALAWGQRALTTATGGRSVVVALAEEPGEPGDSSLGFMLRLFMQKLDGREREAWLLQRGALNAGALSRAVQAAREAGEPLLVLGASFAFVILLEAFAERQLEAPPNTVVMSTGGFKGRTRELDPEVFRRAVASLFHIPAARVISEYGMTELSSQLYEGTLPGGSLVGEPGVHLPPPWLTVTAVDPVSLEPMPDGEIGLARFVDLANVDSAVAVLTQDLVRRRGDGVELCGRMTGAPPRGCSLAVEALVAG